MKSIAYLVMALYALSPELTRAQTLEFSEELSTANEVDSFPFLVHDTGLVNLYTFSNGFNPLLTLWLPNGSGDFNKIAFNDDRSVANFFETVNPLDAKIELSLNAGSYLATVTGFGNAPNGDLLSAGFAGNGTEVNGSAYTLIIEGAHVSEIPLPAAIWTFGAGLLSLLGMANRKARL
jgi:hypothetical protein